MINKFDIHEFLMYPNSLKECLLPLQFINPHEKIRFFKEQFGNIKPLSSSITKN